MKIRFSQVPDSDVEFFGDDGLLGPDNQDNFYYNEVEYGTNPGGFEEVSIKDGCGRYVPISMDTIPELIAALTECHSIYREMNAIEQVKDLVESQYETNVEFNKVRIDFQSFYETNQPA